MNPEHDPSQSPQQPSPLSSNTPPPHAVHQSPATPPADSHPAWHIASPQQPLSPTPGAPAASPAAPTMPASVMMSPKPRKKGLVMAFVAGLAVLVLGAGAAAAYFGYYLPNQPQNILNMALVNSFSDKVHSEAIEGKVTIAEDGQEIGADFSGAANLEGAMHLTVDVDAIVTRVNAELRSVDGSSLYVKVGGLEGLPELLGMSSGNMDAFYGTIIAAINDQWIEINDSALEQFGLGSFSTKTSDADLKKMADAYKQHQFLKATEKLADEDIKGMPSHHLRVVVDKTELQGFITAIKDAKLESLPLTGEETKALNDAIKNVDFNKYPVDIWVTKDGKDVSQITFGSVYEGVTFHVRVTLFDFNKPVQVTRPESSKSLLELISEFWTGSDLSEDVLLDLQSVEAGSLSL